MDLALNNLQGLIGHKTQTIKQNLYCDSIDEIDFKSIRIMTNFSFHLKYQSINLWILHVLMLKSKNVEY